MLRLGLDTSLDEITSGPTDSDVMFDVIEWAERNDQVGALIDAAAESNPQNTALQYAAGGDVIVATIGAGAKDVALGKNITQSGGDAE